MNSNKHTATYHYVQAKGKGGLPEIVPHTKGKKKGEYFYKFLDKGGADALLKAKKEKEPKTMFRVVKLVETYTAGEWQ